MRVLGRACNGDDVVQTHDKVGDKNGLDRTHDRAAALDVAVFVFVGNQQLDAYPYQQQGADYLKEGNAQQCQCEGDQQDAKTDDTGSDTQNTFSALQVLQIAATN